MDFYHSTTFKSRQLIIKENNLRKTEYDFPHYLDVIFNYYDSNKKIDFLPDVIQGQRQVPYLGDGVYCFDNKQAALNYNEETFITIHCDKPNILDVDEPEFKLALYEFFAQKLMDVVKEKFYDEDMKQGYAYLSEYLLNKLYDIEDCSSATKFPYEDFALMLFLYFTFEKHNEIPDVLCKNFPENPYLYYNIVNTNIIKEIS